MLSALPPYIEDHLQWWICGLVAVLCLAVYGFGDLIQFSVRRVWAISSVCFAEGVRRKVWLITPLAIIGVIAVSQLQHPNDERDAIRQTIKFCLFATGLLVTITAVILACTNLPREIENRVIYTVVTKPTTRMEIIAGKILGFARVSALIVIIMGLFTYGYLQWRAWRLESDITERLSTAGLVDPITRPTLEYYRDAGLLVARDMAVTNDLQIFAHLPVPGSTRRVMSGTGEGQMLVPFELSANQAVPAGAAGGAPGLGGLAIVIQIGVKHIAGPADAASQAAATTSPTTSPTTLPAAEKPSLLVQIYDAYQNTLISTRDINDGKSILPTDLSGQTPLTVQVSPAAVQNLFKSTQDPNKPLRLLVGVSGLSNGDEYFVDGDPVWIVVPAVQGYQPLEIHSPEDPNHPGQRLQPIFRGRQGTSGQQLRGDDPKSAPIAIFHFDDAVPGSTDEFVTFEFKSGIEHSMDFESADVGTEISVTAYNRASKLESSPVTASLESNLLAYFKLPASYLSDGNFDIRVRCDSPQQYIGLIPNSLGMIRASQTFGFNLVKSLSIMWLMAILVISISIFTSTFVSWPTAIVLTLLLLLGHWGVQQLGDSTQPGIGNMVATDMGFTDPNQAKVVSSVAETLARTLNYLSAVLPDISQFAASEDMERGLVVPKAKMLIALEELLCYGLAAMSLAYVRLKQVEVAP